MSLQIDDLYDIMEENGEDIFDYFLLDEKHEEEFIKSFSNDEIENICDMLGIDRDEFDICQLSVGGGAFDEDTEELILKRFLKILNKYKYKMNGEYE